MTTDDMPVGQELLSLEDAAEFLCVSKSTMYRLLDQRKLAGMKAGKQWRFRKADLLTYMQRGPAAQALAKVPMAVLDAELAFFAAALERAGAPAAACDDPALTDEAGKITQLVRRMVWLLTTLRGGDIHLNPVWETEGAVTLCILRVDGALREVRRLPYVLHDALVLEWKRLAELPIDERQRPLHGRAQLAQLVALHVATVPTLYGEKVTARTIPTQTPTLEMLDIAHPPFTEWADLQHGLLLIVGPTGSGKTTTRVALIREIMARGTRNILSIQHPVEYIFPQGVTQLNMTGFSPAEGMRAVQYHDPDVIDCGYLDDDPELAQHAVWAAETGHLVLAGMHANDAMTPLEQLLDWGIKRALLARNLIGVIYQQLAPKLCPACKTPSTPEPPLRERIRQAATDGGLALPEDAVFYRQAGCPSCGGRTAMHEIIAFTPAARTAFLQSATLEEFTAAIRAEGQLSMFASMAQQALAGRIALETLVKCLP